jgi:hypothetical protein
MRDPWRIDRLQNQIHVIGNERRFETHPHHLAGDPGEINERPSH